MAECIKQTEESKIEGLLREGVHSNDIEKNLLEQFQELHIIEKKNIIAALLMFLSAQEEDAFDRLLTREQD